MSIETLLPLALIIAGEVAVIWRLRLDGALGWFPILITIGTGMVLGFTLATISGITADIMGGGALGITLLACRPRNYNGQNGPTEAGLNKP